MKRLERLTALLSLLQSRKFTPIQEIVHKFEISERTAFRDLKALEEAGVPIASEKEKGYFILDRHFLPPLAFTIEEAKSFIFVEQLARKYTDSEVFRHFSSALEKIKNKLRLQQIDDLETLQSSVTAYINPDFTVKYLSEVEKAIHHKHILEITYQDAKGNETQRRIEPIGVTFYSQAWHLIAYCQKREAYRDFSLMRIIQLKNTLKKTNRKLLTLWQFIKNLDSDESY